MTATSYFSGLKAIRKWSQFNKFALSYAESQLDTSSRLYRQALRYQWQILDECSKQRLTKEKILDAPEKTFTSLLNEINSSPDLKIKRACGNSWIAPHNWEGFLLNFGDMLVKYGELDAAREIYMAAKLSPSYKEWVYKGELEKRIANLKQNNIEFNRKQNLFALSGNNQMMISSSFSCTGCHQMSNAEFVKAGYREPRNEIYFIADLVHK
jgi:hypothetical protein